MVVNDQEEVVLLIEIEESKSGNSPKKLLGDIFAILCCNRVAVKVEDEQKLFKISPDTQLIIATHLHTRNGMQMKINEIILPRLRQFAVPIGAIPVENISFVVGKTLMAMLDNLKSKTKDLLAS